MDDEAWMARARSEQDLLRGGREARRAEALGQLSALGIGFESSSPSGLVRGSSGRALLRTLSAAGLGGPNTEMSLRLVERDGLAEGRREAAAFLLSLGYGSDFAGVGDGGGPRRPHQDVLEAMVELVAGDPAWVAQASHLNVRLEEAYYCLSTALGDWRSTPEAVLDGAGS